MMAIKLEIKEKNLSNIRDALRETGVFYSSLDLAEKLKSYLPQNVSEVYDPTCGSGALLSVFPDHVKKYGQELDPNQAAHAQKNLINAEIVSGDTLRDPAFKGKKFQAITANPPFSIKWEPLSDERFNVAPALAPKARADFAFILHCLHYLADDGKAIVLDAHGVLFRGNAEGQIRAWMIENNFIERLVAFDSGYFADTSIPTVGIVLSKSKTTTDIYFEDTTHKLGRSVPLQEIRENDYNLNFPRYVWKDEPQPEYDYPLEVRRFFCNVKESLEIDLDVLRQVGQLSPKLLDYKQCVKELKKVLNDAERNEIGRSGELF